MFSQSLLVLSLYLQKVNWRLWIRSFNLRLHFLIMHEIMDAKKVGVMAFVKPLFEMKGLVHFLATVYLKVVILCYWNRLFYVNNYVVYPRIYGHLVFHFKPKVPEPSTIWVTLMLEHIYHVRHLWPSSSKMVHKTRHESLTMENLE